MEAEEKKSVDTEKEKAAPLEERVVKLLQEKKWKISTAESCTGGAVAAMLVNVPGASDVFDEGFITYSNKAKHKYLGVKKSTLKEHGAVSKKTAKEMCGGLCKATGAQVGVGITGIAGPGGGTPEKPVGLVYIGVCVNGEITVKKCLFSGSRSQVRLQSVQTALEMVLECAGK